LKQSSLQQTLDAQKQKQTTEQQLSIDLQKPAHSLDELRTHFHKLLQQENEKTKSLLTQSVRAALDQYRQSQAQLSKESSAVPRDFYEQQIASLESTKKQLESEIKALGR
jgi:bacterioferritin (cytochrome b1)